MFHTFNGFNPTDSRANSVGSTSAAGRRRTNTVRACEQCRRRKIRCDGQRPCEACQWYQKTALCRYTDPLPQQKYVHIFIKRMSIFIYFRSRYIYIYVSIYPLSSIVILFFTFINEYRTWVSHTHALTMLE